MCGFFSNDPLISLLKSFGYNVVRLPRADISPLQVLTEKDKEFHMLGELETIFKAGPNIDAPETKRDIAAAKVSGQNCGDLKFGIGKLRGFEIRDRTQFLGRHSFSHGWIFVRA